MLHTDRRARILVVDDHVIIRRGLRNLVTSRLPSSKVSDVSSLNSLLHFLEAHPDQDLLLLDLQLGDGNALDHIQELRSKYPRMRILIYTMTQERIYCDRVLSMGCAGFLSKEASEEEVIRAIVAVLDHGEYMSATSEMRRIEQSNDTELNGPTNPFDRLSARELRVLDELLDGNGVTVIAERLGLGLSTVATYKARLFDKLGIDNLMELQAKARAHGYRST